MEHNTKKHHVNIAKLHLFSQRLPVLLSLLVIDVFYACASASLYARRQNERYLVSGNIDRLCSE